MTQATAAFTAPLTPPPTVSDAAAGQPEIKARAEHVDFFYGSTQALHDISLDFPEHAVTALIGPSGCGKSTFLRCLNRMNDLIPQTRTTGSITLDGEDINGPDMDVVDLRRRVGMVFQRPNPFPKSILKMWHTVCVSTAYATNILSPKRWKKACAAPPFSTK